ncbi:MAG: hypothetical protein K6U77_05390 [Armatimonadetes bacterium]|nr:hypothetical protein [Armatimonadota bacterium]
MRRTRSSSSRRSDGWLWAALAVIVGLHLLALPQAFHDSPIRADSDTAVMLDAVQQHGALRWLVGDWLLENGFYRPISSVSIALDYALYGESGWGFRLTNWLLMILTALGAWALVRAYARLVGSPHAEWLALGVGVALSLQQIGLTSIVSKWSAWWFVGAVVGIVASRKVLSRSFRFPPPREGNQLGTVPPAGRGNLKEGGQIILAIGALFWGFDRLLATEYTRLITWVPSRTALLGAMFGVWAMYALLRGATERRWGWLALGGVLYLLALGSYEQPIMLVALVGALAFWRRRDWGGWGARAFAVGAACAVLVFALRFALLPAEPTAYQRQQLRSSLSGPVSTYLTELLPPVGQWQYWRAIGAQLEVLLVDKTGWDHLVGTLLYLGVLAAVWRWRGLLGGAWLWHALAFLPMAFLHFFEHYMYLPQLGKTLFDVGLIAWGAQRLGVELERLILLLKETRVYAQADTHT